jgi:hypothetical protein
MFMVGVIAPAFSIKQVSAQIAPVATRNGDIVTKPDGWPIPDVSKLKVQFGRKKFKQGGQKIYNTGYETIYKSDDVLLPKMNFDGTTDPERKVKIYSLVVYDIDKRVFCYRMLFYDVPLKGEAGVGVLVITTYYDLDGDGKFESFDVTDEPMKPLLLPQWVIKK